MSDSTASERVLPGDLICTTEEYAPGTGCYETEGNVHAALAGVVNRDTGRLEVTVLPFLGIRELQPGDTIYGTVLLMRAAVAVLIVKALEGYDGPFHSDATATLHISQISEHYSKAIANEMQPEDLIRARVIGVDPALEVATQGESYGVVMVRCPTCDTYLDRKDDRTLTCPECETEIERKVCLYYRRMIPGGVMEIRPETL